MASWVETLSGGPSKDGIPALDAPTFHTVAQEGLLTPREPVITVEIEGETPRAYLIRHLTWHEILNDTIGDIPVAGTFCPLCNSGVTFDRRVDMKVLSFGVSSKLRNSDMIMYDRETQNWDKFVARNLDGLVMNMPDFGWNHGANPYVQYDSSFSPFLYFGEVPPHDIHALARVVRVGDAAWPLTRLAEEGTVTEDGVTLSWTAGQASALDTARIADRRDVGNVRVRDAAGNDLAHGVMFACAFHAFWSDGDWKLGGS